MRRLQSKIGLSGIFIVAIAGMIIILGNSQLFGQIDDSVDSLFRTADTIFSSSSGESAPEGPPEEGGAPQTPLWNTDWSNALNIISTLLLTSVLSALISYRRRGGREQMDFTEAHVILSVAAALMMMIIGSQIARAFGLMGAASMVRYRYSLKSPKEASSLVIALAVGMACGVGLYPLAIIVTIYVFILVLIFEKLPSKMKKALFAVTWNWNLRIRTTNPDDIIPRVKKILEEEEVAYNIKRIRYDRGSENDQTEIEIEISGNIDRNYFAEEINCSDIIRIRWKRETSKNIDDLEIK